MQEVPIVTARIIVGIESIEAVHGETPMTMIAGTGAVKTVRVVAHNTGMNASASANTNAEVIASSDASDVSLAKPADMTHTAADVRAATNATQPADVSPAAKSADVSTSAEATAHAARVAAAEAAAHTTRVTAATAAAARVCLRGKQARRQQGRRQNRYHLSHRFLHSVMDGARHLKRRGSPKLLISQR
jgi:hypothetical protein